jgi:hypothetical protein
MAIWKEGSLPWLADDEVLSTHIHAIAGNFNWSLAVRNLRNLGACAPPPFYRGGEAENRHTKLSVTKCTHPGPFLDYTWCPCPESSHIPLSIILLIPNQATLKLLQVARKGSSPIWTGVITSCAPLSVVILSPVFGYLVSVTTCMHTLSGAEQGGFQAFCLVALSHSVVRHMLSYSCSTVDLLPQMRVVCFSVEITTVLFCQTCICMHLR